MTKSRPSAFSAEYEPQPQLQVVVHAGPLAGKGFLITADEVTFGRDPENTISWDDTLVSRFHARLVRQGRELILEDLGSTNGTLINGQPVSTPRVLQPADIISIGSSIFGIKGFSAPATISVTQVSKDRMTLPPSLQPTPEVGPRPPSISRPAVVAEDNEGGSVSTLLLSGIAIFMIVILALAAVTAYYLMQGQQATVTQIPSVIITAPRGNDKVLLNAPVTVQATASDPSGVTRMELWVDEAEVNEAVSPLAQGQSTLTASLQWTPQTPGFHTLEVRAYNAQNRVSEPVAVLVEAVEQLAVDGTPTSTPTAEPPTATPNTEPQLTTIADLNVRSGPGTDYDLLGLLPSGTATEIVGRDETRQWWQIRFGPSPTGIGWVAADPSFSKVINVDNVPVAQAPPTPTVQPTSTPTNTPEPSATPTSVPASPTPTGTSVPSPTPTLVGPQVDFVVSDDSIQGGECVRVSWAVTGVREVYYQGEGVAGIGDRQECPAETTTYRLRIVAQDGTEQVFDRTVAVTEPVASAGRVTLAPQDTIDLDSGEVPGNDFRWDLEDEQRRFRTRGEAQLALLGVRDSLEGIDQEDCEEATFGAYEFVDASDVIADPANALRDGFTVCYLTSEDRYGKLRFPRFSTGALEIEWVTWP
ncbi:MAG TPA: FHA domain-containing protein [Anaerolineae bacterium]|nr:FHA domain-containing protein [Anaerolineae bacterium]